MQSRFIALFAGVLFGVGLAISQMINPNKILAFLNVAGNWDPSLALVLLAAVTVSLAGFQIAKRWQSPLFDTEFHLPTRADIDRRLTTGAAIFGVGWGLAGYCPGPVISAISIGTWEPFVFIPAMLAGALLQSALDKRRAA